MSEQGALIRTKEDGSIESISFDMIELGSSKIGVGFTKNPVSGAFTHAFAQPISGSFKVYFSDWYRGEIHAGRAFDMIQKLREIVREAKLVTIGTPREIIENCVIQIEDSRDQKGDQIEGATITYTQIEVESITQRRLTEDEIAHAKSRLDKKKKKKKKPVKKATAREEEKGSILVKAWDGIGGSKYLGK